MESNQPYCLNVPEVAKKLGISRARAYELTNVSGFPAIQYGKRILVPVEALKTWLEEQAKNGRSV